MGNLLKYVNDFFDDLEIYEDITGGHNYKVYLRESVIEFLKNESKRTAFSVYEVFFDSYRIILKGETNPFIDLLDMLKSYEENASVLIDKQRDHYIHSVNVFILGLAVYSQNTSFRKAFENANLNKSVYPYSYDTKHEEFFYRWGLASLLHDVGYPVEITAKQIDKFMEFTTLMDGGAKLKTHLSFDNAEELNTIEEVIPRCEFTKAWYESNIGSEATDALKPLDLLAYKLHSALKVEYDEIANALNNYIGDMNKFGFVDHGFYSTIIVLKWYGYLIQSCNYRPEAFFQPVLDSASAILLHNYYRNYMVKGKRFDLGPLNPHSHPVAFLLILCDELQEWNREAYGILDRKRTFASEASMVLNDKRLDITYITKKGALPENFAAGKENDFSRLLDMKAIFANGFSIGCEAMESLTVLSDRVKKRNEITPRPLLENLEKLAIAIHELYNQKQLERHPEKPLEYPHFSDLTDSLKYSNLRQARDIADKLDMMGCEMRPAGSPGEILAEFDDQTVELLSAWEHDSWVRERMEYGWSYGRVKDVEKKISPYLVPYEELSEDIKDLDRDTIRNIPVLLGRIGMAVYIKRSGQ